MSTPPWGASTGGRECEAGYGGPAPPPSTFRAPRDQRGGRKASSGTRPARARAGYFLRPASRAIVGPDDGAMAKWGSFPETGEPPRAVVQLAEQVERDGGHVLGCYQEPLKRAWQLFVLLPLERVQPTPYQRDLSKPH